ncbi:predicted protein [Uncinocarpus reesii 1704]|uniref:MARVEL domain-containing protein n=1 Tax=Uncinocarpus reesii (strain UAMH 1704) TaxID=336963 RepID=C4JHV4_UNCRE|nr:uncharacterized protein UREG_02790 [Uncinocarpus reesii 1704]EEP77941.1 predicted protein [Uncinocarpus reesii 1704]
MAFGTLMRFSLLLMRLLQWASAVIVMGIVSYFIKQGPKNTHLIYEEVIAVISVVFFLPGLVSPFVATVGWLAFPIDLIFSYLWLTSFIFASQDYSAGAACWANSPPGIGCALKHASQAFIFIAFFCTMCSAAMESWNLWNHHNATRSPIHHSKEVPRESADTAVTGNAGPVV